MLDGSGKLPINYVALSDQTLILNLLRLVCSDGLNPEGLSISQISDSMDIPIDRDTEAGSSLLKDGNIRFNNGLGFPGYVFLRESEKIIRQERTRGEFLQNYGGWETDDVMPDLEEY